jgi:hypothetical protein
MLAFHNSIQVGIAMASLTAMRAKKRQLSVNRNCKLELYCGQSSTRRRLLRGSRLVDNNDDDEDDEEYQASDDEQPEGVDIFVQQYILIVSIDL